MPWASQNRVASSHGPALVDCSAPVHSPVSAHAAVRHVVLICQDAGSSAQIAQFLAACFL